MPKTDLNETYISCRKKSMLQFNAVNEVVEIHEIIWQEKLVSKFADR